MIKKWQAKLLTGLFIGVTLYLVIVLTSLSLFPLFIVATLIGILGIVLENNLLKLVKQR